MTTPRTRALALFSGGLDSILAAKMVEEQGIDVIGLHFISPFFGKPQAVSYWKKTYGISVKPVDVSDAYVNMLVNGPVHGFGSVLNPCIDCKILMLETARSLMETYGASFLVSGEILGQRPMSQRRDALNIIRRDAAVKDILLRPLCAKHLDPIAAEREGLIDRELLGNISGRGRKEQMLLAQKYGLTDIPTPAGGCLLTEQENGRRFWPVLHHVPNPSSTDFRVADTGRQFWSDKEPPLWLCIGRNNMDNTRLMELAGERDLVLKVRDFPGPIALGRYAGHEWGPEDVREAASFIASYSPKAVRFAEENGKTVAVRVHTASLDAAGSEIEVTPTRSGGGHAFAEYSWERAKAECKAAVTQGA